MEHDSVMFQKITAKLRLKSDMINGGNEAEAGGGGGYGRDASSGFARQPRNQMT